MKKILLIILMLALAALLIISGLKIHDILTESALAKQAQAYIDAQEYDKARDLFVGIGRDDLAEHCEALLVDQTYSEAKRYFDNGEYETARALFEGVGNYRDADDMRALCNLREVAQLIGDGKLSEAARLYIGVREMDKDEALIAQIRSDMYDEAFSHAKQGDIATARELWQALGEYTDAPRLARRAKRMTDWLDSSAGDRIMTPANLYIELTNHKVYVNEKAYFVIPNTCGEDTRFFIYFPGGRDEELYIEYFESYTANPAPDTVALFLRYNGLDDVQAKCAEAVEQIDHASAECGVFMTNALIAGSSLGAYPAMHSPLYLLHDSGVSASCVLALDAGDDWQEPELLLTAEECAELAELGTPYYLFDSTWVGMNREGIRRMVNGYMDVTIVGCFFDDHAQITNDALGLGVINWALGDRTTACDPNRYLFIRPEPEA